MNKTTKITLGLLIIVAIGGGIVLIQSSNNSTKKTESKKPTTSQVSSQPQTGAISQNSTSSDTTSPTQNITPSETTATLNASQVATPNTAVPSGNAAPNSQPTQAPASNATTPAPAPTANTTTPQITAPAEGLYTAYSGDKVAKAESQPTVIFFHASWCPTCKAAEKSINENTDGLKSSGVQILKTDYDTSNDLKKKYGVTSQSTFIKVDKNGNLISKGQGYTTLNDIISFAKK